MNRNWKREIKQGLLWVGCGMVVAFFAASATTASYAQQMQQEIATQLVRFHVVANSDAAADQALKMKVRHAILTEMEPVFASAASKEAALEAARAQADYMAQMAREMLAAEHAPYDVRVEIGPCRFPAKQYGEITLPAGVYDAVNIYLGAAAGQNFWCVLYPSLCVVEETKEESLDLKKMGHILSCEAYSMVTSEEAELKWKVVEWWQEQWGKDSW